MRYAHELMNGEHIWERSGGEPTNKYLISLGFEIKSKSNSLTNEQPITGNIWKLGCNWDKGNPSFYNLIKENEIVVGVEDKKYSVGDLILITEGFNAMSIAKILQSPQLVTDSQKFQEPFEELSIPFEDRINISNVEWYELEETERFTYQLQAGIRKVQDSKVKQKVIDLWNSRNSNYWIFQGNPNAFDFETAIRENLLEEWTVSAHKDIIKVDDKVILWIPTWRSFAVKPLSCEQTSADILHCKPYLMTVNYNKEKIKSSNLYQLFSYLLNQQDGSSKTLDAKGILLYPTIETDYNLNFKYYNHNVQIRTVNLNSNWRKISSR